MSTELVMAGLYVIKKTMPSLNCPGCDADLIDDDNKLSWTSDGLLSIYKEEGLTGIVSSDPDMSHEDRKQLFAENANITIDGDIVCCEVCDEVVVDPDDL